MAVGGGLNGWSIGRLPVRSTPMNTDGETGVSYWDCGLVEPRSKRKGWAMAGVEGGN